MSEDFTFRVSTLRFDDSYEPRDHTRLTTNFANLARGAHRRDNLRRALRMIDNRFNALAHWDNPTADRYSVELDILSVEMDLPQGQRFPVIEMLKTSIRDHRNCTRIAGLAGNNFSSYVRDYDFSLRLRQFNQDRPQFDVPEDFGDLHGKLFKSFLLSPAYRALSDKPPVICLSVSHNNIYQRTAGYHPVLGAEYLADDTSLTESYFGKMGLKARYFMPEGSVAPLAFYHAGDLTNAYSDIELIATIATMESFQRIYRPEIYNANARAAEIFRPSLTHDDYSPTRITYDRDERSQLALSQGQYTAEHLIKPHQARLAEWAARFAA